MQRVGVLPNLEKKNGLEVTRALVGWLQERGVRPFLTAEVASLLGCPELGGELEGWAEGVEFVIVLGGDGTLLSAAKALSGYGRPILGVNLGHLGFLTEIESHDLFSSLPPFLAGRYMVEQRMMLEARVWRDHKPVKRFVALNDAVISKGPFARLVLVEIYVNETFVALYPADGVIVSTPTGSTAYSLSAGGPVVNPNLDVLLVTPICPHSFYGRSIVVSKDETIRVKIRSDQRDAMITLDGQEGYPLQARDDVVVGKAPEVARLMRRPGWSFYEVLRRKLAEREWVDEA